MTDTDFNVRNSSRLSVAYADAPVRNEAAQPMTDPDGLRKEAGGIVHFSPGRIFDATAYLSAGSGMVGTATDYLLFLEALRRGGTPILQADTVRSIVEDQVPSLTAGDPGNGFGLGVGIVRDPIATQTPKNAGSWGWGGIYGTILGRSGCSFVCGCSDQHCFGGYYWLVFSGRCGCRL